MDSSYLFAIDGWSGWGGFGGGGRLDSGGGWVIDATVRGNIARFINHSCAPNCNAFVVQTGGRPRIVICSTRYALKQWMAAWR